MHHNRVLAGREVDPRALQRRTKFRWRHRVAHRHDLGSGVISDVILERSGCQPFVNLFGDSIVGDSERDDRRYHKYAGRNQDPSENLAPRDMR